MFYPPPRKRSRLSRMGLVWVALPAPVRMGVLLIVLVLAAFLSGCATKPEGVQITITEAEAKACVAAGGCALFSHAEIANIQFQAYMLGQREALGPDAFDSQGCKRGAI